MTNIYEKMAAIQAGMPTLQKDGQGPDSQGKYKYLKVDDILAKIKPLLDLHKVIVIPSLVEHFTETKYGQEPPSTVMPEKWSGRITTKSLREWVCYEFDFIDTENPESHVVAKVSGEAVDSGDKASRKAMTSAWKTALIQTFALITGEPDPDGESGIPDEPKPAKATRQEQMSARAGGAAVASPATKPSVRTDATPAKETPIEAAKTMLREAIAAAEKIAGEGAFDKQQVDAIGFELFKMDRSGWVNSPTKVKAIAKRIATGEMAEAVAADAEDAAK